MKTTVEIDDVLLLRAKKEALRRKASVRSLVEEGLRKVLDKTEARSRKFRLKWNVDTGSGAPAIDPADRRALHDFLDNAL